jgi:beta-glucosidase
LLPALFLCSLALAAEPPAAPADPALIPVTPTPGYFPNVPDLWESRHQSNLHLDHRYATPVLPQPDFLMLGDSITAQWGNSQSDPDHDHLPVWSQAFGRYQALNFGIGGNKTENILWEIEHGELDSVRPRVVILAVGVNNLFNLAVPRPAIAAGLAKCVEELRAKLPEAELIVVVPFPHEESPTHLARKRGDELRAAILALDLGARPHVHQLDLGDRLLQPDGTLKAGLFKPDHLHLTDAGYEVYAQGLEPMLTQYLGR